MTTLF